VRPVPEVGAIQNNLTRCEKYYQQPSSDHKLMSLTRQLDVLILDTYHISILAQLLLVEVLNRDPQFGQTHEFLSIDPRWVREHTTPINYSDRLIGTKQDFICTGRHAATTSRQHPQQEKRTIECALEPRSPSGPPVWTFVMSFSRRPSCL
jgi:hypothetical protein